ncbi:DNA starvation/stationary phase protection protein [Ekhidna sp.]|uniref:Dps family protein n=1 Tax=Ekhidna sp. TaxID=2608089 RepID=UPI0032976E24
MSEKLISELNQLLSDFHIYYQNTRGAHWNIKGPRFFELHAKFEELYTEALTNIDDIAERILTIGGRPDHTLETYLKKSNIKSIQDESNDEVLVKTIVSNLTTLVAQENKVKELAVETGDNETEDMMIGLVNAQEKTQWMFNSWLGK